MKIGLIGLGRMGTAIGFRLSKAGYSVIGFDQYKKVDYEAEKIGITYAANLQEVAKEARVIWIMVPIAAVDDVLQQLMPVLKADDIIIDGGNSFYQDSLRRSKALKAKKINFLDCGTSGGLAGKSYGFCLMVGGDKNAFLKVEPFCKAIARPGGLAYIGPSGTGHYVKMIHNGIEYGLLQAYAEGFQIIKKGSFKDVPIDLEQVSGIWQESSVIRSFLLELFHQVFEKDQNFSDVMGEIEEGGMGAWTMQEAQKHHISAPILKQALEIRAWSRQSGGDYATKLVALVRKKFGGHSVKLKKGSDENI